MAKAPSKNAKAQLALALAQGVSAAKWGRTASLVSGLEFSSPEETGII